MAVSVINKPTDSNAVHSNATGTASQIGLMVLSRDSQGYYVSVYEVGSSTRVGFFRLT